MVSLYWALWITKYTALLHSNKRKIVMTIFHQLQRSLIIYFNSFFYFFIYFSEIWYLPLSYYKQLYYKLPYKFSIYGISQNYSSSGWNRVLMFLRMPVNLSQYCGAVELFNSRSTVNRSKVNSFVTSNYRNKTYIACSLIFDNKIFLFLWMFSVSFFLKNNVSKINRQFLVSILLFSTILLIRFVFFQSSSIPWWWRWSKPRT